MDFLQLVQELDPEAGLKIILAVILGGMIGLERELRGRPAGLRTLILVCLGATMIMIVSHQLPNSPLDPVITRVDPGRIASGIVTGIGFLGAGVIIKLGDLVRGVTTAATIWFVAGLGIILGQGHYALAVVATLTALGVLWLFGFAEKFMKSAVYRIVEVTVRSPSSEGLMNAAKEVFKKQLMRVMEVKVSEDTRTDETRLDFYVRTDNTNRSHDTVKQLSAADGVLQVRWY